MGGERLMSISGKCFRNCVLSEHIQHDGVSVNARRSLMIKRAKSLERRTR